MAITFTTQSFDGISIKRPIVAVLMLFWTLLARSCIRFNWNHLKQAILKLVFTAWFHNKTLCFPILWNLLQGNRKNDDDFRTMELINYS